VGVENLLDRSSSHHTSPVSVAALDTAAKCSQRKYGYAQEYDYYPSSSHTAKLDMPFAAKTQ
jgi:hypothetical protein